MSRRCYKRLVVHVYVEDERKPGELEMRQSWAYPLADLWNLTHCINQLYHHIKCSLTANYKIDDSQWARYRETFNGRDPIYFPPKFDYTLHGPIYPPPKPECAEIVRL